MENYNLKGLNDEQRIPAIDTDGAVLVTAGAGSGKTRMLTHRIAYLVSEKEVAPYNILAITFTNKAAAEMKERLYGMLPETKGLWISTFHSMCVRMLRRFADRLGFSTNFSIYSETEKERVIKQLIKENYKDAEDGLEKNVIQCISRAKNEGMNANEYEDVNKFMRNIEIISDVYDKYQETLLRNNALDFDDLLSVTWRMLQESEEARAYYQERFKYIHVDEFQDTNTIQYKLLIILGSKHKNIFAVGDEDQSIYGWRGANINNIKSFIKDFSAKVYKLEQNYRSTKKILDAANTLISNNTTRIEKSLWTENDSGTTPVYYAAQKDSGEADYVINTVMSLRGKGLRYSDIAILMRVNALSRGFEQRLLQYGIPYKIFGGFKFFDRKEVKDILAYARIIANSADNEAVLRVINFPKRGIGDGAIGQIENYCTLFKVSLCDVVVNIAENGDLPRPLIAKIKPFADILNRLFEVKEALRPHEFLARIVELIGLKDLYADFTEENQNRIKNIEELVESAAEFSEQNPKAGISEYLQMVTLYTDTEEMDDSKDYVSVATVHSVKGLEFSAVFVAGLEDGLFPLSRAADDKSEMEEERRLMYVAVTRAKKWLFLTRSRERFLYGGWRDATPSRFLLELGLESHNEKPKYTTYSDRYGDDSNFVSSRRGHVAQSGAGAYFSNSSTPAKRKDVSSFSVGMAVKHKRFGIGKILSIADDSYAEIEFGAGKLILTLDHAPLEIVDGQE